MIKRTYQELIELETFEDRFDYLQIRGLVGETTFGHERWMNQRFYTSVEWKAVRNEVLVRDLGNDLALPGYSIAGRPTVHHMNPMMVEELVSGTADVLDPRYLITVSHETHNAIHYGSRDNLRQPPIQRRPGDTVPWR